MKIKGKKLLIITFLYIYIPIIIFLWGWTKPICALAASLIIIVGNIYMIGEYAAEEKSEFNDIKISFPILILAILVIVGVCVFVGLGGIYPQAGDWYKHNGVIRDLTFFEWPVYYDRYDKCMLTYYLGQYMLPSFFGKLFHSFDVSNISMMIWGIFGLILAYIHLLRVTKANEMWKQLTALVFMFLFCGALALCQIVLSNILGDKMYSLGSYHWILVKDTSLQYRSNLVMIRWVYPQVIVPWIVTILFLEHYKNIKFYMLLILPTVLFGTFSFGALAVMAIMTSFYLLLNHDITIKQIFHPFNVLSGCTFGVIGFFYFLGNVIGEKPINSSLRFHPYTGKSIITYVVFCFFMFGIYAICVWKENKKNIFLYTNVAILMILPWFEMGLCNDIVMSGSIPSLFVIMIFVLILLFDESDKVSIGIRKGIVIVIFMIGCIYPIKELTDNIKDNKAGMDISSDYSTLQWFTNRKSGEFEEDLIYNYYTYDLEGKFFYKYIARKKLK